MLFSFIFCFFLVGLGLWCCVASLLSDSRKHPHFACSSLTDTQAMSFFSEIMCAYEEKVTFMVALFVERLFINLSLFSASEASGQRFFVVRLFKRTGIVLRF